MNDKLGKEIFGKYYFRLIGFIQSMFRKLNKTEVEDIAQISIIKLLKRVLIKKTKEKEYWPMLITIAKNTSIDYIRTKKSHINIEDNVSYTESIISKEGNFYDVNYIWNVFEKYTTWRLYNLVFNSIEESPKKEYFRLYFSEEYTINEISMKVGKSPSLISKNIMTIRLRLLKKMKNMASTRYTETKFDPLKSVYKNILNRVEEALAQIEGNKKERR